MFSVDGCRGPGGWQGTCDQYAHHGGAELSARLPDVPQTSLKALKHVPQLFTWQLCLSYSACKQFGHGLVLTSHAPGKSKMLKCNTLVEALFPGFTELGLEG